MSIAIPPSTVGSVRERAAAGQAVRQLEDRLSATRGRVLRRRAMSGVCFLVTMALVALAVMAVLDYSLELATAWRAAWLLALSAGTIAAGILGWRRLISSYSLSQAAVDAEQRAAQFGQRLRTTLDYETRTPQPAPASVGLLDALHVETAQVVQQTDWNSLVDKRPLRWALAGLAVCMVGWFVMLLSGAELRLAAGRAILLPWEYTTVRYTPESSTVKFGEDVTIEAEVSGRPIPSATLRYRPSGSQEEWTTLDLVPPDSQDEKPSQTEAATQLLGALSATLADLQQDLEFEVLAGPRRLPAGSIRVLQPLKLKGQTAHIIPPAYTGRKDETVTTLDLTVLEGSTIELTLELSRPAAEGMLASDSSATTDGKPDASARDLSSPLIVDGVYLRTTLTDLRKSASFTIAAKAADGITLEPVRLDVKVKLDRPASITFIAPPEELSVTPTTDVPMIVEAGDDLGLFKVGIEYQIGAGPLETLWEEDAAGSTDPLRGAPVLMLEEYRLTHQDAVTYFAYAEDNYFGQPRRTTTPLRYIDIRPFKQAFQLSEGGGSCCGNSATLEEFIMRQRQQLSQAFAATQQAVASKETTDKLASGEAELLEKTVEFWEGLVAMAGPIPTLEKAVDRMKEAVKDLAAGELSKGLQAEQEALAALIKARENVRQKLNQSPSASQCQKFDKAQRQKLRLPEKKEQDKQQKLAEARKKLDDLAKREREWSQQAKQSCPNPSASGKPSGKPSSSASSSGEPMPNSPPSESEPSQAPSREAVAKAQEKMLEELAEIQKQLPQLSKSGEAAKQQAEQAAQSMQKGLQELKQEQGEAAAKAGERSAEELEQLAEHLAAMNAKDIGQRLDQAQKLAQQLAARQEAVEKQLGGEKPSSKPDGSASGKEGKPESQASGKEGKPDASASGNEHQPEAQARTSDGTRSGDKGQGDKSSTEKKPGQSESKDPGQGEKLSAEERALATKAKLLAEQLAALERDAAAEPGGVGKKLADAAAESPPKEIAAAMEKAAEDLKGEHREQAGRGVAKSREQLQQLSRALGDAKSQYAQPQLEELMKLEERLAQLMQRGERAKEAGSKPSPADAEKWQELAAKMESLAAGDKKLGEVLRRLRANEHRQNGEPTPPGVYPEMELLDAPNLREVAKALQSKIQEAILAGALMDADQPVPREYRELVDKYYKALSDDLR